MTRDNPFAGKGAFDNAQLFIGFEKTLQGIKESLAKGHNISIVGAFSSGKSTLLNFIEHEGHVWLPQGVTIVRFVLDVTSNKTDLETDLSLCLGGKKRSDLRQLLTNNRLILLLDNIGALDIGKQGLGVREWLKSLMHSKYGSLVQLVTASSRHLSEIFEADYMMQRYVSPFHGMMNDIITLEGFTRDEAHQFITARLAGTRFSVEDFSDMLDSVWIPGDLQDACRVRFDELCRASVPDFSPNAPPHAGGITHSHGRQYEAFMLYTEFDNKHNMHAPGQMCVALSNEVQAHTGKPFRIFQDVEGIKWGQKRAQVIDDVIKDVIFLIPVITPSFFTNEHCRHVLQAFLTREQEQGRNDLVLPVRYMETPKLEDLKQADDELMRDIAERHPADWRDLRFSDINAQEARQMLSAMAKQICDAIQRG